MTTTVCIGEKKGVRALDRFSFSDYPGSQAMRGTAMLTMLIDRASVTVHGVTPAQLRELSEQAAKMAEALEADMVNAVIA